MGIDRKNDGRKAVGGYLLHSARQGQHYWAEGLGQTEEKSVGPSGLGQIRLTLLLSHPRLDQTGAAQLLGPSGLSQTRSTSLVGAKPDRDDIAFGSFWTQPDKVNITCGSFWAQTDEEDTVASFTGIFEIKRGLFCVSQHLRSRSISG